VCGGLIFSQGVTLLITPVLYIYMEQAKEAVGRLFRKRHVIVPEPAAISNGPMAGGGPIQSPMARSISSSTSNPDPSSFR
jgi:hypothetical protein